MKKILLLSLVLLPLSFISAQLNMTYKSEVQYQVNLSDVWGHADNGREYALVGAFNGVSIIDVTDTENPVDLGFADGVGSTWRDIKVFANYAYVTNETSDGLMVIDLSNLPTPITEDDYYNWEPDMPGLGVLIECHNIYIDEVGYGYLTGCNLNTGGPIFIDLFSNPGSPEFVAAGPPIYSHDVYVRDNLMYSSEIYEGAFAIYDVNDKQNVTIISNQETPFLFTHNTWLSDDSNTIFTTDEKANAPVAAYDISDVNDIKELDQFRPLFTIDQGVLPHNVFVWQDWLIISYYADGCILADASRPDNIIEVGNFDTVLPGEGSGAWGVYPFLPSGTVLVSDIGNGLYILEPNYVRACWLEGLITNEVTGAPINDARVEIESTLTNFSNSDFSGIYKTGQAISGTFNVEYSALGYVSKTVEAVLENGEVTILNVELEPLPNSSFGGQVVDADNGAAIPNAVVQISNEDFNFTTQTDANGNYNFAAIVHGDYEIIAGVWGYQANALPIQHDAPVIIPIPLTRGYADEFALDLGWEIVSSANAGIWERGEPNGTVDFFNNLVNPEIDAFGDIGDQCYVTGNGEGQVQDDDVDNGFTRLVSPIMNLSNIANPILTFDYWFVDQQFNGGGGPPNDHLQAIVTNGTIQSVIAFITESENSWQEYSVNLADFIPITGTMQVSFEVVDQPSGHLVEGAIDRFKVVGEDALANFTANVTSGCFPLEVTFTDPNSITSGWNWNFDGAMPATSTQQNPTVTYFVPGTYSVELAATTPNGVINLSQDNYITIAALPTASFTYEIINDTTVVFSSSTTNTSGYTWSFGDGSFSTEANPTYTYTSGGLFQVVLQTENECGSSQISDIVNIEIMVGTEDLNFDVSLDARPNPFQDQLTIDYDLEASNYKEAQLNIYNNLGQLVEQSSLLNQLGQIQVANELPNGLYFVQLTLDGQNVKVLRVIKQ